MATRKSAQRRRLERMLDSSPQDLPRRLDDLIRSIEALVKAQAEQMRASRILHRAVWERLPIWGETELRIKKTGKPKPRVQ